MATSLHALPCYCFPLHVVFLSAVHCTCVDILAAALIRAL